MKKLLFLWVLVLTTFSLKAQSEVLIGDLYYNLYDDNTAEVTAPPSGEYGNLNNLIIPASVEHKGVSYSVTSIGSWALSNCYALTSITIPNSVTTIGDYAFCVCENLISITIPNSVTSIGDNAFSNCSSLTSITILNAVTSIGNSAFANCRLLTSITIPNSVTSIGGRAFSYCDALTSVTIGENVTSIGHSAFASCDALNSIVVAEGNPNYDSRGNCNAIIETATNTLISGCKSTIIPNSVTSIGDSAFYDCSSLTSITIPESVTSIGSHAFYDCSSLTSVAIGKNVTSIGYSAFYNCYKLTSVTIGENVTSIGSRAFYDCSSLTSISIPESVTSIGSSAFEGCDALTSVTIGKNVTSIGIWAFDGCTSLTSVTIEANTPPTIGAALFSSNPVCTIPCRTLTAYQASDWAQYVSEFIEEECEPIDPTWQILYTSTNGKIVTPNATDVFGANIVSNTYENGVGTIIFDGPVTSIGERAFYYCEALTSITIPESVTSIGSNAFFRCWSLTSITIPISVTSIGDYAFSACLLLNSITIPNSVTSIGYCAFNSCYALTSITIPKSVTSIGDGAFIFCNELNSIVVAEGNPNYDSRGNCNAIIETATNTLISGCKSTIIPNSVTSIGDDAFYGYWSLTSIIIPNSVTSIGDYAFNNCESLASITIPNSVTSIGEYAFSSCESLTSISIPESVTSIGSSAFEGCDALTSVTIGKNVTSIGIWAFDGCTSLTSVTIEANTPPTIGTDLFTSNPVCTVPCGTLTVYQASDWAQYVSEFVEGCEEPIDPTWRKITYTSTDGTIVTPNATDVFGANIVSNTYENGQGVITFNVPVTSIGDDAFRDCRSLTSITIPNSVTSIGNYALNGCSSLTSITIPESVTSIEYSAFRGCSSLTSITIPESVTSIGEEAFASCDALSSIVVAEGNPNYDSRGNCNAIIKTATNTLISGCKSTIIPNSVTSIGNSAFYGCEALTSITIPNSVTSIGNYAFRYCYALTSVTIGENVTSIGYYAFEECSLLTSITIPNSVTSIGFYAFYRCEALTSITIPESVTSIGFSAFSRCTSLTSVTIEANTPPTIGTNLFTSNPVCTIPCGTLTAYQASDWAQYVSEFIEEECEELIDPTWQIFYTSTDGEIVTPGSGTNVFGANIVSNTYENGQGVITFDGPVTSIGNQAFWIESALTSITIPNSVTSIGNDAFCACENLKSITIPNSVTSIGSRAFSGCYALTSVTIPNSVKSIGDDAFRLCSSLTSITIPESVTSIGKSVFNQCSSLTSITIPNTVKSIGDSMFFYCSSLTSITIPNSVTSIGKYAFSSCSSLTSITIPECVTSIGIQAFMNCKGLTTITIPKSVTSIGDDAFSRCTSLTSVTIEANTPPTIGTDLFSSNPVCTIPCGTLTAYQASDWAQYVSEFVEECEEPEQLNQPDKLYFHPSTVWKEAGARFAAHFLSTTNESWVNMSDSDGDGIYEVENPKTYNQIRFCRIDPNATSENISNNVWQATNTLQIPNNENDNALNTCYAFYKNDWSLDGTWVVPTPLTANNCWTIINTYQDQTINIVVERQFFDIGEWYTLCLPFSCNASIFGEAHQFASLDVANDIVTIMTSLHNTIEAGAPYLFRPLSSYDHFIVENVKIPSFVTPQTISVSGGGFTISLTSVLQTEGTTEDTYWIGNGGYLYNEDVDKLGLRAYFNISKPAGMAPRFRVSTSEENATGFDILIDKENHTMKILENGQLVILRNGEKYNIQGQKL